jgi:hypothetical protein
MIPVLGHTCAARIRHMTIRRCIPVFAFVALALAVTGCTTSDTDPAPVPPTTSTTTPSLSETPEAALTQYCQTQYNAAFTGSGEFAHPAWGPSLLATCLDEDDSSATVLIANLQGSVLWAKTTYDTRFDNYVVAQPVSDRSGNLFITYTSGGADMRPGVEVLSPTEDGAESISMNAPEWEDALLSSSWNPGEAFFEKPLFSPATAAYDADVDVYRVQLAGNQESLDNPWVYEWVDSKYELVLNANQWLLGEDAGIGIAGHRLAIGGYLWSRVTIEDGYASVDVCSQAEVPRARPTCTRPGEAFVGGPDLVGELADGSALIAPPADSGETGIFGPDGLLWGILHVDANGVPVSIERPEGTECTLANGDEYTGNTWMGGTCPKNP